MRSATAMVRLERCPERVVRTDRWGREHQERCNTLVDPRTCFSRILCMGCAMAQAMACPGGTDG